MCYAASRWTIHQDLPLIDIRTIILLIFSILKISNLMIKGSPGKENN